MDKTLEERIQHLERAHRWWQFLAVFALLGAIGLAVLPTDRGVQKHVQAHSFSLVNDSGEVLARLADTSGGPVLLLRGRSGSDLLIGSVFDDVGFGIMADGNVRTTLVVGPDGFPMLGMSDRKGANRLLIGLDGDDMPVLLLRGESDGPRLVISLAREPLLQIMDGHGVPIFAAPPTAKNSATGHSPR
jgi:hypothetical protein